MKALMSYIIIIEVIIMLSEPSVTVPLCQQLNQRYYHQPAALADSVYAFEWARSGATYPTTRMVIGEVAFLLDYDAAGERAILKGTCGNTDSGAFSVQNKTLTYQKNGFSFDIQCFFDNDSPLKIRVQPRNSTSIEAFKPQN